MIRSCSLPADIDGRLETLGHALESAPYIVFAYLFGSAVAGRQGPLSDVDIAVFLDPIVAPADARLETVGLASRHLATDAIDVVVLNTAPTALTGRILEQRRVILDRDPFQRHRFESRALREHLDFRPFEHRLLARRYRRG
jgi:predicted nucleotidyltransferase